MPKHQLKTNIIYCGDNLQILKEIPDESIDLIYIDPPFNSNRNYEAFWGDIQEKRAFEDRFGDAQHYIEWMRPRILELYRVLRKTGSFYYHCDWHASHYVKIMLDQMFNFNNFQNELVWCYEGRQLGKKQWNRKHDVIFFYVKSKKYTFNWEDVAEPLKESSKRALSRFKDESGKYYVIRYKKGGGFAPQKAEGESTYRQYVPEKVPPKDWFIIDYARKSERRGYPTQKPLELLEKIILASSNKGDVILDAFCGCGTTLVEAQKLGRKWIGIDISPTACRVMAQRLWDIFKLEEGKDFIVNDFPKTEEELMKLPHFEFQNWAVIALGGIPNRIKVGDYGIDGKLYPIAQEREKTNKKGLFGDVDTYYPIQVKQKERAGRPDIDAFETAMRRDKRKRGYFISFGFTDDAVQEIKRLDKEGEIEIVPIAVKDLLQKETLIQ